MLAQTISQINHGVHNKFAHYFNYEQGNPDSIFIITCKGVYVTTDDILFASMSTEQLWHEAEVAPTNRQVQFEKAIAVEVK